MRMPDGMIYVFKPKGLTIGIEAKELVFCKNCRRWKDPRDYECPYHTSGDPYIDDDPEETFFCGKAERKEE